MAQLVIVPYWKEEAELVEDLDATSRGMSGFGSTGLGEGLAWS
jgi:dUTPase